MKGSRQESNRCTKEKGGPKKDAGEDFGGGKLVTEDSKS